MGNTKNSDVRSRKPILCVSGVLKILAILCIVFVFCPSFLVSCSGRNVEIDVMSAVGGMSTSYGGELVEPHPIMLICLLIPIFVFVILFLRMRRDTIKPLLIFVLSTVDLITYVVFRTNVKKIAENNYCEFKTTGWYVANMITLVITILIAAMALIKVLSFDTVLILGFHSNNRRTIEQMARTMNQMTNTVSQFAGGVSANVKRYKNVKNAIGYCQSCGYPIEYGDKFCQECGKQVPISLIKEAEIKRVDGEKNSDDDYYYDNDDDFDLVLSCSKCGSLIEADSLFCDKCGTKIDW